MKFLDFFPNWNINEYFSRVKHDLFSTSEVEKWICLSRRVHKNVLHNPLVEKSMLRHTDMFKK